MKITDVQACVIGRQEPDSGGSVWTFVRIYTDEGIVGTGECNSGGPGFSGFATKQAILALKALDMALATRTVIPGSLVHHSDRGVQYACGDYIARLEGHGILPSMSRVACPYDNAMAESFIKTLKSEQVEGRAYRDLEHARDEIGSFIELVYNRQRLHSALGYRPPVEFEDVNPPTPPDLTQAMVRNTNCH